MHHPSQRCLRHHDHHEHLSCFHSDEELMMKPKYSMRKFCDICDVFDEHETDECPLQEGGGDTGGVQHHGDRNHERPYCGICESKNH